MARVEEVRLMMREVQLPFVRVALAEWKWEEEEGEQREVRVRWKG